MSLGFETASCAMISSVLFEYSIPDTARKTPQVADVADVVLHLFFFFFSMYSVLLPAKDFRH